MSYALNVLQNINFKCINTILMKLSNKFIEIMVIFEHSRMEGML